MVTVYHNPRCSKSRAAVDYLTEQGVKFDVVEYLKKPLTAQNLKNIAKKLGIHPREMLRVGEDEYKEFNLQDPNYSEEYILNMMVKYPKLIERPIIINGSKACIARPIENLMEMLK